jgi:hypothetical protein
LDFGSVNETGEPQKKVRPHHGNGDRQDNHEG